MTEVTWAGPLKWPPGWPVETSRAIAGAKFGRATLYQQAARLADELRRLGAVSVIVTSNLRVISSGLPYADQALKGGSSGIAVYFTLKAKGAEHVMCRDAYASPKDNLASLALAIEGLRTMKRHGGAVMLERAFAGFTALAAPVPAKSPWTILGIPPGSNKEQVRTAWIQRVKIAREHGKHELEAEINDARDRALKEIEN